MSLLEGLKLSGGPGMTLLRLGMLFSLCQFVLHDIERHTRPISGLFKVVYLSLVNVVGALAIGFLVFGLRKSRNNPNTTRAERIVGKVLLGISAVIFIGDLVLPILINRIANTMP
jgi:hypothetical protein